MARVYAGILGTLAMAAVLCRGVKDSGGVDGTLSIATLALVGFALLGSILGHIAQSTVDESVRLKIERELNAHAAAAEGKPPAAT